MTIQIYNTLTRKKEPFEPLHPPVVTIYSCGPTVYDRFHIGNARAFIVMDIVRRYFEYRGYQPRYVQNLTDIEDKIINRAREEGVPWTAIIDKYIPAFHDDARKLRIRPADLYPRATEHIDDIIAFIGRLIERKAAYVANGSVYFSVRQDKEYGKLSGRKVDDLMEGARVEVSEEKQDPADFVLWKAAKPDEPSWDSPWGPGRPGWHIECSVMSTRHLGETIDIHAGGSDLIFPHHENEIAQSEAATGKPFVRFWMHNGFLKIDNQKMSKSLGNFVKIDQILERHCPATVRFFLLAAHYRHPMDLTAEALEEARGAVRRINDGLETGAKLLELNQFDKPVEATREVKTLRQRFETAMDDDFNTPRALAVLFDVVGLIHEARQTRPPQLERLAALVAFGTEIRAFFSLEADAAETGAAENGLTGPLMELIIETRQMARKEKAFAIADRIRDRLGELGIVLEDHPEGTIWKRKEE